MNWAVVVFLDLMLLSVLSSKLRPRSHVMSRLLLWFGGSVEAKHVTSQ